MSVKRKLRELNSAEEAGQWNVVADLCSEVGKLLAEQGEFRQALDYHRRERDVCEEQGDAKGTALAHRSIGEMHHELFEFDESIRHKEEYLAMSIELRDGAEEQRALYLLGQSYQLMAEENDKVENTNKAMKYFEKSLLAVKSIPARELGKGEREIMRARCLRNLFNINWQLGRTDKFTDYFNKARDALNSEDAKHKFEDHHGLYDEAASLLVGSNDEHLKLADTYSRQSLEKASRVHGKREKVCRYNALVTRSKVNMAQEEFEEAYKTLFSAYKLGVDSLHNDAVENNLKMTVVVVRARQNINTTTDVAVHKQLENIADALCEYMGGLEKKRVLEIAVKYYHKAVEKANVEGATETLPSLNNSIAQTYMDIGDYLKAEKFFQKQLEYEKGQPESACQTYSNIASVQESLGYSFEIIQDTMQKWLKLAQLNNIKKQERIATREMAMMQARLGKKSNDVEDLSSSCDSLEEDQEDKDIFSEIDLDTLEISDALGSTSATRRPRRINSKFLVKKNNLGDSRLHSAVQVSGKAGEVINLLEMGHPLEITDNNGWTPLGDAVGHMNLEYAKILLSYGANINHINNDGDTPFLTACGRGWLDGVKLLMEKGANVQLKNNKGYSGLNYLRDIIRQQDDGEIDPLEESTMQELNLVIRMVEDAYTRLGVDVDLGDGKVVIEDSLEMDELPNIPDTSNRKSPVRRQRNLTLDRSISTSPEDRRISPRSSQSSPEHGGKRQYQEVIENLRGVSRRSALQSLSNKTNKTPRARAISSDLSDWLEDDLSVTKKKSKRSLDAIQEENVSPMINDPPSPTLFRRASVKPPSSKPKKGPSLQPTITQAYERISSRSPSPSPIPVALSPTPPAPMPPTLPGEVTRVRVKIESLVLLIPLSKPDVTIEWLAGEAATRYCRAHGGVLPVLSLSTSDGALLDQGDLVTATVDVHDPVFIGHVVKWISKSPEEKYKDFCTSNSEDVFENVYDKLIALENSNTFSLCGSPLYKHVDAVLNSLQGSSSLTELCLSGCKLTNRSITKMTDCLSTLDSLKDLDLSSNMFSNQALTAIASMPRLPSVTRFDFSRNMLGNFTVPDLSKVFPNLTNLSLKACYLSSFTMKYLKNIQCLDISLNKLGSSGIESLLKSEVSTNLIKLNISGCIPPKSGDILNCEQLFQFAPNIDYLDISNSNVTDKTIQKLNSLSQCKSLTQLNLSFNDISANAFLGLFSSLLCKPDTRLNKLWLKSIKSNNVFWDNVNKAEFISKLETLLKSSQIKLEELVLPGDDDAKTMLAVLWDNTFGTQRSAIVDSLNNIILST